jgi:hypothetical protein
LETIPSSPTEQACWYIAGPSTSKLSLYWMMIGFGDQRLQVSLAFDQRQLPQVVAFEIEQVERDHRDLCGFALKLILQHREVGGARSADGTTISPSMIADAALTCQRSEPTWVFL